VDRRRNKEGEERGEGGETVCYARVQFQILIIGGAKLAYFLGAFFTVYHQQHI
jgi:hypothetical protein